MGLYDTEKVATQGGSRLASQVGGAGYGHPLKFYGIDNAYLMVGDVTIPDNGGISPVNIASPLHPKEYEAVATEKSAPDFPAGDLAVMDTIGGPLVRLLQDGICRVNLYDLFGLCGNPNDYGNGWDKIRVFAGAERTGRTLAGGSFTADAARENSVSLTYTEGVYEYGQLSVSQTGNVQIDSPVIDSTYWSARDCGYCGPANNGTQWRYGVVATSGAIAPFVVYSLNDGQTAAVSAITGTVAAETPVAIRQIGDKLVVFVRFAAGSAHYWTTLGLSGIPQTWTRVVAGYTTAAPGTILDVAVTEGGTAIISGTAGYIYQSRDITQGVTAISAGDLTSLDLTRIQARGRTVIAAGTGGALLRSVDSGSAFVLLTAPAATAITAIAVVDAFTFWIFTGAFAYWTNTAGETYVDVSAKFPGATAFDDARFASTGTGYVTYRAGAAARLATTFCGGEVWTTTAQPNKRLGVTPTHGRSSRIAVPATGIRSIDNNYVLFAGQNVAGTDGLWLTARPTFLG